MVFGACKNDFYFADEMVERNGYVLLHRVFLSMKGISYKILKVIHVQYLYRKVREYPYVLIRYVKELEIIKFFIYRYY